MVAVMSNRSTATSTVQALAHAITAAGHTIASIADVVGMPADALEAQFRSPAEFDAHLVPSIARAVGVLPEEVAA